MKTSGGLFFLRPAPILVYVALILLQPDLGTSIDILVVTAAILFVAGLSWKWIAVGIAGAIPVLYLLISQVAYGKPGLMAFLHPDSDPQGAGFQLLQSLIAVGSGGFTGVGLMESKQKLFYLPEAHHGFYLCGDLRGAGLYRGDGCACALCHLWLAGKCVPRSALRTDSGACWRWESPPWSCARR